MKRFLIEVTHEAGQVACDHAAQISLNSGSHFLTHADWGCTDGEHKAWMVVEVENKDEARYIVPPAIRPQAKIIRLSCFSLEKADELLYYHQG